MRILNVVQIEHGTAESMLPRLRSLQEQIGSQDVAFNLTTEPEGGPPFLEKLTERLETFRVVREGLADADIRVGILAQTTLGHAERYLPRSPASFQRMVNTDGQAIEGVYCPLDPGFQEHLTQAFRMLAGERPAFILVDDDFRLSHPQNKLGCFCPLHLDLFSQSHGTTMTRIDLLTATAANTSEGEKVRAQWQHAEFESLLGLARRLRAAIDDAAPEVPAGICTTPSQRLINDSLARAFAGSHRPMARMAGNVYMEGSAKQYPLVADQIMRQRRHLADDVETLVEADTFPHHGYSVSGKMLSAHLATATVLGLDGAKAWVVPQWAWRGGENPQFVHAYADRSVLAPAIEPVAKSIHWRGVSTPIRDDEPHRLPWSVDGGKQFLRPAWVEVAGRMAIPHVPGGDHRPVQAFSGTSVMGYSDTDWEDFFGGGVLLDGAAAALLTDRGFADHLGVHARPDPELRLTSEMYRDLPEWNGASGGAQRPAMRLQPDGIVRLVPTSPSTIVLGDYITQPWRQAADRTTIAPSVTAFHNGSGGRVAVYAAGLESVRPIQHFIDPYRRAQLLNVLRWLDPEELRVTVDCDTDLYLLVGDLPDDDDKMLIYALNLQADPITSLGLNGSITSVETLTDGTWTTATAQKTNNVVQVDVDLGYLDYALLRVRA